MNDSFNKNNNTNLKSSSKKTNEKKLVGFATNK